MKVFISYSWDSDAHKTWVQDLAEKLFDSRPSIEVIYDRVGMDHQVDRNKFMEKGIFGSDAILAIVTSEYTRKANERKGGVGRETAMAAERHWEDIEKKSKTSILAVKREKGVAVPSYLKASLYIDFSDETGYEDSFAELVAALDKIINEAKENVAAKISTADRPPASHEYGIFSFTRTEDLIAGFYKQRTAIVKEEESRDFSGQRRVKYELWIVDTPNPQLLLVLLENITIRQTLEDLVQRIQALPQTQRELKILTVLRPSSGRLGYIHEQLVELGLNLQVAELTFKDYLSKYCIEPKNLRFTDPYKEPFYIDQAIYMGGDEQKILGPAKTYLLKTLLKAESAPLSLLVASGGAGKTTLLRHLASEINQEEKCKVLLIEADTLRKLPRPQLMRLHVASLFDLYQLHLMALAADGSLDAETINRPSAERSLFELLLINGSILILIDGIDELVSLMQDKFELVKFIESINELNSQMGQTRVLLASREDTVSTTVDAVRKHGIPIYSLQGFSELEVSDYTKKRFSKRSGIERDLATSRVVENVKTVSGALGGMSNVLPFFVDVLCDLEEETQSTSIAKIQSAVKDRLYDANYLHNNTVVDLLVFAILDRERERQGWAPSVGALVDVFKEISSSHFGLVTVDNFSQAVETFLSSSGKNCTEIFSKNPLLSISDDVVTYKYDFLNLYFLSLWLIEMISAGNTNDIFAKHISRYATGQGTVFDDLVRYFGAQGKQSAAENLRTIYKKLKSLISDESENPAAEIRKMACSAILQLGSLTVGKGQNRPNFTALIFSILGDEFHNGKRKISQMYLHGDFPVLHFTDIDVWNSEFHSYENLTKSRFENAKFYYCKFRSIHGENRSPLFSREIFDLPTCELGELSNVLNGSGAGNGSHPELTIDEVKRFFRYFFVGGGFAEKSMDDLYQFSKPGLTEEFVKLLLGKQIIVVSQTKDKFIYGISLQHKRPVQKFVNENNLYKVLRETIQPYIRKN